MTAHDTVAGNDLLAHPEIGASVRHELVDFLERVGVEELLHPLTSGQFPLLVLFAKPLLTAAELSTAFEILEFVEWIHSHNGQRRAQKRIRSRSHVDVLSWLHVSRPVRYSASIQGLLNAPIPSTFTIMRSPGLSGPTPDGVPVVMMSPGSSVQKRVTNSISSGTGKMS